MRVAVGTSLKRVLIATLVALLAFCQVAAAASGAPGTPEKRLVAFYTWYLSRIENGQAPVASERGELRRYVSESTLKTLVRRYNRGTLDSDYFTKSQDVLDDWPEHIAVSDVAIKGRTATARVVLGATEKLNLFVSLVLETGEWKIRKVTEIVQ